MVSDHGDLRIAVVLFQDGYRFIYFLSCQDGDCDVTVRTLHIHSKNRIKDALNSLALKLS